MKTRPFRRRSGFTLIELLVVIAIIAVLAAAGFGMVSVAINKAKRLKATQAATSLEQAINGFYSEYGRLPDPSTNASSDTVYDTTDENGITLLKILLGKETSSSKLQNDKKMSFLTPTDGKGKKGGIMYDSDGSPTGLYDPWGNGFKVMFDYDYDEVLKVPSETVANNASAPDLRGKRAIAYSLGAEKKGGSETCKDW